MHDEWSGFTRLLAELIEKHASELNFDDMPIPKQEHEANLHKENKEEAA